MMPKAYHSVLVNFDTAMMELIEVRLKELGIKRTTYVRLCVAKDLNLELELIAKPKPPTPLECPYCGELTTGADCRVSTDQGHVWVHIPCYEKAKYILPA